MRQRIPIYFVLYLVLLVEMFVVIQERDQWLSDMLDVYRRPPTLSISPVTQWTTPRISPDQDQVFIAVSELRSITEKSRIRYHIRSLESSPPEGWNSSLALDGEGNGYFQGKITTEGRYRFEVWCEVERDLPDWLPEVLRDRLAQRLGTHVRQMSTPVQFDVIVADAVADFPPLTLNVQKEEEKWLIGREYTKTIFVGGTEPTKVHWQISDARFALAKHPGRITLTWTEPVKGETQVTVRGRASRGMGAQDIAQLTFHLDVVPPRWIDPPEETAFWGVPYQIKSRIQALHDTDYELQLLANDDELKDRITPLQFPYSVIPERSWRTLTLRAISGSSELITSRITIRQPPPPAISWLGGEMSGNDFVLSFRCEDVNGSDVSLVEYALLSPPGLSASVNTRKGKYFEFTVHNVRGTGANTVKIRIKARGIGGITEPLDKSYVLPL
jgi:hypothetical protein